MIVVLAISPDATGYIDRQRHRGIATSIELSLHERLAGRLALDAGVGCYGLLVVPGSSATYASVSLSWGTGALRLALTGIYSNADEHGLALPSRAGGCWVGSAGWSYWPAGRRAARLRPAPGRS